MPRRAICGEESTNQALPESRPPQRSLVCAHSGEARALVSASPETWPFASGLPEGSVSATVCAERTAEAGWAADSVTRWRSRPRRGRLRAVRRPQQPQRRAGGLPPPRQEGPVWLVWLSNPVCQREGRAEFTVAFRRPGTSVKKRHRYARKTAEQLSEDLGRFWKQQSNFLESGVREGF